MSIRTIKKSIFLCYVFLAHAVAVYCLMHPDAFLRIATKVSGKDLTSVATYVASRPAVFYRGDATVPKGSVIFLGDSYFDGLAVSAISPSAVDFAIGGATTTDLQALIPKLNSIKSAGAFVLNIGINDFGKGQSEGLMIRFDEISQLLPAKTPLIWLGITPTPQFANEVIGINRRIEERCHTRLGCIYVDTAKILKMDQRSSSDVFRSDQLHLSDKSNEMLIQKLKKIVAALPTAPAVDFAS